MEILWLILIGALVGFLGRLVAGRHVNWFLTIILGIVGNFIGFYVWGALGGDGPAILGYVFGVVAAALLVILVTRLTARR